MAFVHVNVFANAFAFAFACEHVCLRVRTRLAWRVNAFETRVHYTLHLGGTVLAACVIKQRSIMYSSLAAMWRAYMLQELYYGD